MALTLERLFGPVRSAKTAAIGFAVLLGAGAAIVQGQPMTVAVNSPILEESSGFSGTLTIRHPDSCVFSGQLLPWSVVVSAGTPGAPTMTGRLRAASSGANPAACEGPDFSNTEFHVDVVAGTFDGCPGGSPGTCLPSITIPFTVSEPRVVNDTLCEGPEDAGLQLQVGTCDGPCIVVYCQATSLPAVPVDPTVLTIAESDTASAQVVGFSVPSVPAQENQGLVNVTISRSNPGVSPATVDYLVSETGQSGTISFGANADSAALAVTIPVDVDLIDGVLHVQLSNLTGGSTASCGSVGGACVTLGQAALEILVDDETVAVDVALGGGPALTVPEGSEVGIPITRSSPVGSIRVDYELVAQTATIPADFQPQAPTEASGSVIFEAGDANPQELRLSILRDGIEDEGETFLVRITGTTILSGNVAIPSGPSQGEVTVTIQNRTSMVRFAKASDSAEEGETVEVQILRSGDTSSDVRAEVSRVGGDADSTDYRILDRQVRFTPGQTSTSARVQILEDTRGEAEKYLILGLSSSDATVAGGAGARFRLTLAENYGAERLELSGVVPGDTASFGERFVFSVRVLGGDNQPTPGTVIEWTIEPNNGATFEDGNSLSPPTGADGIASKTVVFGFTAGAVTVTARVQSDPELQFAFAAVTIQGQVLADGIPRPPGSVAASVERLCRDPQEFQRNPICRYFDTEGQADRQIEALQEISGGDLTQSVDAALSGARVQLENVASRLATLRGGATRQATQQIAMSIQGRSVDPGAIARAVSYRSSEDRITKGLARSFEYAVFRAKEGGSGATRASVGSSAGSTPQQAVFSRWGVFANGRASFGDAPGFGTEEGFKFETTGISAGADYRFNTQFTLGGALGYAKSASTLAGNGGSLDTDGRSFTLFGLFTPTKPLYIQVIASFGQNEFESLRRIDLPLGGGRYTESASGNSDGDQMSLAAEAGLERQIGTANLTGFGRVTYTSGDVGGYQEEAEGPGLVIGGTNYGPGFNFRVGDQDFTSLLAQVGLDLSRAFSTQCCGVIVPAVRVAYLHEFEDGSRKIPVYLNIVGNTFDPLSTEFAVVTNDPDRDYFTLGVGAQALTGIGQFYLFLDSEQQRSDIETWSVAFGFRKEF